MTQEDFECGESNCGTDGETGGCAGNPAYGANVAFADREWSYQGTLEALYFCWALDAGLGGNFHTVENPENLKQIKSRKQAPTELFESLCNSLLSFDDFNDECHRFTAWYYPDGYHDDLELLFGDRPPEDSWKSVDDLTPKLAERLAGWRKDNQPGSKLAV